MVPVLPPARRGLADGCRDLNVPVARQVLVRRDMHEFGKEKEGDHFFNKGAEKKREIRVLSTGPADIDVLQLEFRAYIGSTSGMRGCLGQPLR